MVKAKRPAAKLSVSDQKEFELPTTLTVNDFLFLYEFKMRQGPLLNLDTWPLVTPEEALDLVGKTTLDEMYAGNESLARSHQRCFALKILSQEDGQPINVERLKQAIFDKDCILAYAIPLVFWAVGKGRDSDLLHLTCIFSWANYIKFEINSRRRKEHEANRANDPNTFTFHVEATLQQASVLDFYRKAKNTSYNACVKNLRKSYDNNKKRSERFVRVEASSQFITSVRKKIEGDVPRSVIVRAMKSAAVVWEKWYVGGKKGPMPSALDVDNAKNFSIATGFKLRAASIDVGEAKNIHVSEMLGGSYDPNRPVKYAIIERVSDLTYRVVGKYK